MDVLLLLLLVCRSLCIECTFCNLMVFTSNRIPQKAHSPLEICHMNKLKYVEQFVLWPHLQSRHEKENGLLVLACRSVYHAPRSHKLLPTYESITVMALLQTNSSATNLLVKSYAKSFQLTIQIFFPSNSPLCDMLFLNHRKYTVQKNKH